MGDEKKRKEKKSVKTMESYKMENITSSSKSRHHGKTERLQKPDESLQAPRDWEMFHPALHDLHTDTDDPGLDLSMSYHYDGLVLSGLCQCSRHLYRLPREHQVFDVLIIRWPTTPILILSMIYKNLWSQISFPDFIFCPEWCSYELCCFI